MEDPRAVIVVLNNGDLNQVTWELRAMSSTPKIKRTQSVPNLSFAAYAEMLGLNAVRVSSPYEVGPAWDKALVADRPTVIEAMVDDAVPTLPPHITTSQAKSYAKALLKGDPEASAIVWHSFKRGVM